MPAPLLRNVKVIIAAMGKWPFGTVVSEAIANHDGKLREHLALNHCVWTTEKESEEVTHDPNPLGPSEANELYARTKDAERNAAEVEKKRKELEDALLRQNLDLKQHADDSSKKTALIESATAEKEAALDEVEELRRKLAEKEAENESLKNELDAATTPATKPLDDV